jgi:ketosteroid isomerase-like protein
MKNAAELLRDNVQYMITDAAKWRAPFAEDAVWEFAYGVAAGIPPVLHGIDAIEDSVKHFLATIDNFRFSNLKIYPIDGNDAVFGEFEGDGRAIKTGRTYHQNYVFYVRAKDGKIISIREYFDPSRIVAAFV